MSKQGLTATFPTDSAVELREVTKTFIQWQRDNTGKGLLKNLIKPEKRVVKALDQVSFRINKREFVAYAGPNGSGKSTTMKLLCGMLLQHICFIPAASASEDRPDGQGRRALRQQDGALVGSPHHPEL